MNQIHRSKPLKTHSARRRSTGSWRPDLPVPQRLNQIKRVARWILVLALTSGFSLAADDGSAVNLFENGHGREAKAAFEILWASDPESATAAYYLGRIGFDEGELDEATEWFKKATELDPGNAQYHLWLGNGWGLQAQEASIFRRFGLAKKSRSAYERAVALDPAHVEARESLAEYYLQAPKIAGGGSDKAEAQAQQLLLIHPAAGHRLMARVYSAQEKDDEALASFRSAIEADPNDPQSHYALGFQQQALERWDEALAAFEAALDTFPGDPSSLYQIGRTGALSGRHLKRAQECLTEYLELEAFGTSPGEAAAHWRLGMVYEQQGKLSSAIEHFEASVRLESDFEPAKDALEAAKRKQR